MNSRFLVSLMLGALPLTMVAQDDDMYFVPAKKSTAVRTRTSVAPRPAPVYYSGSNRDVDEYNRRGGSYYQVVSNDSTGNDIIDFNGEVGVYPDSVLTEDYALTRQMSRWDGYEPEEAYREGYRDGRMSSLSWHSPWYYILLSLVRSLVLRSLVLRLLRLVRRLVRPLVLRLLVLLPLAPFLLVRQLLSLLRLRWQLHCHHTYYWNAEPRPRQLQLPPWHQQRT